MSKSWEYFNKYVFSAVDLNSSPHTFNNLQGDKYDYRVYAIFEGDDTDNIHALRFNADSGSNYRSYLMRGYGSTANASTADTVTSILLGATGHATTDYRAFTIMDILGESGSERTCPILQSYPYTDTLYMAKRDCFWKNTTDEITSITVSSSVSDATSGEFYLFRRQKKSVYNSADWELIEEKVLSSVDINGTPQIFNNLQGDVDKEYMLEFDTITASGNVSPETRFNGDTGSNYTYQRVQNVSGTLAASTNTSTYFTTFDFDSTRQTNMRWLINAESGSYRSLLVEEVNGSAQQIQYAFWWKNTADELTSITVGSSETPDVSGKIRLYKRSKKRSTPAHERLIYDYDISGDFSSGYTFQNLDTDKMYRIEVSKLKSSADFNIEMEINGDSGANYVQEYLRSTATTASAATATNNEVIPAKVSSDYPGIGSLLLFPKTGKYRPMLIQQGYEAGGAYYVELEANWWKNTSDDLQDIKMFASASTSMTGNIKIWEIDLP